MFSQSKLCFSSPVVHDSALKSSVKLIFYMAPQFWERASLTWMTSALSSKPLRLSAVINTSTDLPLLYETKKAHYLHTIEHSIVTFVIIFEGVLPVFICTHCGARGLDFKLQLVEAWGFTEKVGRHVNVCVWQGERARERDRCLEEARLAEFTVKEDWLCKQMKEHTQTCVNLTPTFLLTPHWMPSSQQTCTSANLVSACRGWCLCVHVHVCL